MSLAAGAAAAAEAEAEKVLRVKPTDDVKVLDPMLGSDSMARNFGYRVYDTLFAVDASLAIRPQMIET
jgi:peptide/nickel transport system substrate-binding protein